MWNDARIARLREFVEEGTSSALIAVELNGQAHTLGFLTRNAIIGKIYRLGLIRPDRETKSRLKSGPKKNGSPSVNRIKRLMAMREEPKMNGTTLPNLPLRAVPRLDEVATPHKLRFNQLTFRDGEPAECRWPLGGIYDRAEFFCGAPVVLGKSFCLAHCKRAFARPQDH